MDLSGLIFVALAVAWAAYLIPKALRHHDEETRGRSIDRFSQSMRVLAHREPTGAKSARLVVNQRLASPVGADPAEVSAAARLRAKHATKRRRRVLSLLLVVLVATIAGAALGRVTWTVVAVPVGLLVGWLLACRLMVRKERSTRGSTAAPSDVVPTPEAVETATAEPGSDPAPAPAPRDPKLWDPVPTTLPTYVSKPPARRSVRTIDLDSTGVWTSGRTEADSALAREADAAEAADRRRRRAAGKNTGSGRDEAVGS